MEGAVGVPEGQHHANVIATGISQVTGRPFNLIVAFERERDAHGNLLGRAIAESSFHHFVDYNWDTSTGSQLLIRPTRPPNRTRAGEAHDIKTYVANLANWLATPDVA